MALEVHCSVPECGLPMTMPGAVVVSPPMGYSTKRMQVTKYHICALCWSTKFYKLLDDGEFENDAAHWPHLYRGFIDEPPVFKPKVVYEKQPLERDDIPDFNLPEILGRAIQNKVWEDMNAHIAGLNDNRFVEEYRYTDAELMTMMLDEEHARFWADRKKKHPIWDLIKRGWL